MSVVVDSGPLIAVMDRRDRAHRFAAALMHGLRRDPLVPLPVLVECDSFVRNRVGHTVARTLLGAAADGELSVADLTPNLLRRAVEIDAWYADLGLGLVDAAVMAIAERERASILTFDFHDFRAAPPIEGGVWPLLVDEAMFARHAAP